MLYISNSGYIDHVRIVVKTHSKIERGKLNKINGIVVHQTNGPTAQSTFNSYRHDGANGAHFLIDRDGTIYQTASVYRVTWHVGKSQSKCYVKKTCEPAEFKKIYDLEREGLTTAVSNLEKKKPFPNRFPNNTDSIGIEIVGLASGPDDNNKIYEKVNDKQNESLKWLIAELTATLQVPMTDIYRHPEIGRKNSTEASTAKW